MSTRKINITGIPSRKQREFFRAKARYIAYGGARGGGKSWALRRKLVGMCLNYPGLKCLLVRRTYGELKSNHLLPMISEYGELISYSESEKSIVFPNGSRITLGYCASESDVLRYQGQEYDIIAIDEATQLSEYQFSIFCACLRGVNSFPKRIYLTCNPGGIGHSWVKRLFIDRDFRQNENPDNYVFIPALVYDNEALLRSNPEYVEQLGSLPPKLREAWLEGRWDVFEGQFFSEFNEEVHVIDADSIQNSSRRFIAFDYGFDMLALLMISYDANGNLFVEKELAVPGLTLGEAGEAIVKFIGGRKVEYAVASPDLWNRRQDSGKSGFEVLQSIFGMPPMVSADNRRIPGWRILKEYLSERNGKPKLRICSNCVELTRCLKGLLYDKLKPEDASSEPHSLTHLPEALRYAVMGRFSTYEADNEENTDFILTKTKSPVKRFLDI